MAVEAPRPIKDRDYHFREDSLTPPVFFGHEAERQGIAGIRADTSEGKTIYMNLFDGYATGENGEREDLLHYRHPKRRGAFEYVVSDPKDPSIYGEVLGDNRIESVRLKARALVARFIEENAEVKVTKQSEIEKFKPKVGKLVRRKTNSLAMVGWDHVGTRESDPGRHWHLVAFNISHDKREGKNKAIELYHIDKPKLTRIYRDAMRKGLHELGYKTKREGNEYRIVGTPPEVKALFSRRTNGINDKIAKFEEKTGKELKVEKKKKFSSFDIPEKSPNMPLPERRKGWLSRLTDSQKQSLANVVSKAKKSVTRSRWRSGLQNHLDNIRRQSVDRPIERSRNERER